MTGDTATQLAATLLMIVLVSSSLFSRRSSARGFLGMAVSWLMIFGIGLVLFSYRQEVSQVYERVSAEIAGESSEVTGGVMRVRQSRDGHFWVAGTVNGSPARFLVDTGATQTLISPMLAQASAAEISQGFPVIVQTANGQTMARRARVASLAVGPITQSDARVLVSDAAGNINLLGMSFLTELKSWRVEGNTLILEPKDV